jgi:hypothetical protein
MSTKALDQRHECTDSYCPEIGDLAEISFSETVYLPLCSCIVELGYGNVSRPKVYNTGSFPLKNADEDSLV